jgi:HD-GYP domain-containing protein (c-di-GMP phosphodiesterase class II)
MRAIPPDHLFHWALGFLLHDIGKSAAVEYHEGQSGYNRDLVIEHVKVGCDSVMHKTNYPKEAGLVLGCHHEYYGDSSGYGYFRNYLEYFKKIKPNVKHNYCMAGELEALLDFETCAYFPAKILEIIDIYDSITDPNRVYRNVMSPEEALTAMRGEFIEQRHKIDIILFDIFCSFIRENHK